MGVGPEEMRVPPRGTREEGERGRIHGFTNSRAISSCSNRAQRQPARTPRLRGKHRRVRANSHDMMPASGLTSGRPSGEDGAAAAALLTNGLPSAEPTAGENVAAVGDMDRGGGLPYKRGGCGPFWYPVITGQRGARSIGLTKSCRCTSGEGRADVGVTYQYHSGTDWCCSWTVRRQGPTCCTCGRAE